MKQPPHVSDELLDGLIDRIDSNKASQLIENWYRITAKYRLNLGVPRTSPYCQNFRSSRQYENSTDLMWQSMSKEQFNRVDFCINKLETPEKIAIEREMKNRHVKAKVWEYRIASSFEKALSCVIPFMREKGLLD